MANIVFNIAKGKVAEYYDRVENGDPAASRLYIIPISAGAVSDATAIDVDTFEALVTAGVSERTANGWNRKTLSSTELATGAPTDAIDYNGRDLPTQTWTTVSADAVTDLVVCYAAVGTPTDAQLIPLTMFDFAITPDGSDVQMTGGEFFRAS